MSGAAAPGAVPAVQIAGVSRTFTSREGTVRALDGLTFAVQSGEIAVLLGPSGCGKTTLLRSIAGLEVPDEGEIAINGRSVFSSGRHFSLAPEARGVSMVFQSYALWPHMSIADNVAYPLHSRKVPRREITERVELALETVGCAPLAGRFPHQLSGGQAQRVALARAIVAHQGVILFDEPLSNVDAKVRERLRIELLALQRKLGFAAVYVTHDQTEAMIMATRIAVMERGRIVQVGSPGEIYEHPQTHYVADFVGAANFLPGEVTGEAAGLTRVRTEIGLAQVPTRETSLRSGDKVEVFFRPEHARIAITPDGGVNSWRCTVEASLFLGPNREYVLSCNGHRLLAWTTSPVVGAESQEVWLSVEPTRIGLLSEPGVGSRAPT